MNEGERRRFESLESLRKAAYDSFDSRRSYEWKVCFAIWTALSIALVALLQPTGEDFPIKHFWGLRGGIIVAAGLVLVHIYLSLGFKRANGMDKAEARRFKRKMGQIGTPPLDEGAKDDEGADGWWSHVGQVAITFLLAATAVLIVAIRSS